MSWQWEQLPTAALETEGGIHKAALLLLLLHQTRNKRACLSRPPSFSSKALTSPFSCRAKALCRSAAAALSPAAAAVLAAHRSDTFARRRWLEARTRCKFVLRSSTCRRERFVALLVPCGLLEWDLQLSSYRNSRNGHARGEFAGHHVAVHVRVLLCTYHRCARTLGERFICGSLLFFGAWFGFGVCRRQLVVAMPQRMGIKHHQW